MRLFECKDVSESPFLNPDPPTCWSGPENIAWARIDDEGSWLLLDGGSTINAVTPKFIEAHSLDVSPLGNLVNDMLGINGFGGLFSWPLGYVIIWIQVEGIWGYDEDQVALVIPDSNAFGFWVPVTLGTPIINWIINVIKESKIDELLASLNGSKISCLLACHWAELSVRSEAAAMTQTMDPTDLNEAVRMMKTEEIDTFSSKIIHSQTKTMLLGNNMHVMMQILKGGDQPCLPHGLSVMNTYTEVTTGSKWVAVILKNLMAILIIVDKGIKVTQVVAVNAVPQVKVASRTLEKID